MFMTQRTMRRAFAAGARPTGRFTAAGRIFRAGLR